ncbi:hypothetical protein [Lysinibacillus sp. JNUCC 51]|uniref:hypothetical protein n=1 Tax=Lysinibacillus sp. JNUCC-51 TaxID=2792479 RepID=UPI0019378DCE|nr:hypothetical protein JNUCC51_16025 [Lysinibacillus sp. JNUCC-51]
MNVQSEGKSTATVKNDLATIRHFHIQILQTRYLLSSNQVVSEKYINFNLERRRFGGIDCRPTELEYQALISLAKQLETLKWHLLLF